MCSIHLEYPESFNFGNISCRVFSVQTYCGTNPSMQLLVLSACCTTLIVMCSISFTQLSSPEACIKFQISNFCPSWSLCWRYTNVQAPGNLYLIRALSVLTVGFVNLFPIAIEASFKSVKPSKIEDASRAKTLEAPLKCNSCPKHAF